MMICAECGQDNPEGNWVCRNCGATLARPEQTLLDYDNPLRPSPAPSPVKPDRGGGITKIILIVTVIGAIAAATLWYFHYRGPDTGTPRGTMEAYINAISDGDCEKIYDLTPNSMLPADRSQAVSTCTQMTGLLNIDFTDYKTVEETINGDTAAVSFQLTVKAGNQTATDVLSRQLIKEDGRWKVQPGSS